MMLFDNNDSGMTRGADRGSRSHLDSCSAFGDSTIPVMGNQYWKQSMSVF